MNWYKHSSLAQRSSAKSRTLSAIATHLTRNGNRRTARLNLYGRIRKGVDVMLDTSSVAQKELLTAGLVSVGKDDELRVRNEIYAMVFSTRWVNHNLPFGIRGVALTAAVIGAVLVAPVWYTEYLPKSYVDDLTKPNQNYEIAADAYSFLNMLPSHEDAALRHYTAFLTGKAARAAILEELEQARLRMVELPDGEVRAKELISVYWDRQARQAVHEGNRDVALTAVLEANLTSTVERAALGGRTCRAGL